MKKLMILMAVLVVAMCVFTIATLTQMSSTVVINTTSGANNDVQYNLNSFSNDLSAENFTFSGTENYLRYFQIPATANVTVAIINITGSENTGNVTIDIGNDGIIEFNHTDLLTTENQTADLLESFNHYIETVNFTFAGSVISDGTTARAGYAGIYVEGTTGYAVTGKTHRIVTLDLTDISSIGILDTYDLGTPSNAGGYYNEIWEYPYNNPEITKLGDLIYVAGGEWRRLYIFNVSDPSDIVYMGNTTTNASANSVQGGWIEVNNDVAYVGIEYDSWLTMVNVTDPTAPVEISNTKICNVTETCSGIPPCPGALCFCVGGSSCGGTAYNRDTNFDDMVMYFVQNGGSNVVTVDGRLRLLNISNSSNVTLMEEISIGTDTENYAFDSVEYKDDKIYVSGYLTSSILRIYVYNVTDPNNVNLEKTFEVTDDAVCSGIESTWSGTTAIHISGRNDIMLLTDDEGSIIKIDVSGEDWYCMEARDNSGESIDNRYYGRFFDSTYVYLAAFKLFDSGASSAVDYEDNITVYNMGCGGQECSVVAKIESTDGGVNISDINITYDYPTTSLFEKSETLTWNDTTEIIANELNKRRYSVASSSDLSANNVTIAGYYLRNWTATECEIDNSPVTITNNYCPYAETINASATWPTHYIWDNNITEEIAVNWTNATDLIGDILYYNDTIGYRDPGNVTAASAALFTNVTVGYYYNTSITDTETLEVYSDGTWFDITPSPSSDCVTSPVYERKTANGRVFHTCIDTTNKYVSYKIEESN